MKDIKETKNNKNSQSTKSTKSRSRLEAGNNAFLKTAKEPTTVPDLETVLPLTSPLVSHVVDEKSEMNIAHDAVSKRAYDMWQAREGAQWGDDFQTWLQAEAALLEEKNIPLNK